MKFPGIENVYIIIPSLNPDEKLCNTVNSIKDAGFSHIIVVDDGSDFGHKGFFPDEDDIVKKLVHKVNKGKGAALKTAFSYILENCADAKSVVTVDGDGQHAPDDVLACAKASLENEGCAILGCRDFSLPEVPSRSKFGNKTTSFVFKALCGMTISDTQTGLRAFSVSILPLLLNIKGDRFEYETNMLLKFKQHRIEIKEVKISTVYIEENSSSHFRPLVDSFRVYRFILAFFISSLISALSDIGIFYILMKLFESVFGKFSELVFTVIARIASSLLNYTINKNAVFDFKDGKKTFLRYYALAIPQMLISGGLVTAICALLNANPEISTLVKAIVDIILFFISYRIQQTWVFAQSKNKENNIMTQNQVETKEDDKITAKKVVKRTFLCIGTALLLVIVTVFSALFVVLHGPSETMRNMLVISAKQASATKWAPHLFLSSKTIDEIMESSTAINTDVVDASAYVTETNEDEWADSDDGVKLIFLNESKFKAYITLVKDPSRVFVGTSSDNFKTAVKGANIFDIVDKYNAKVVINGGEFYDKGGQGSGAAPLGLTYSKGECVWVDGYKRTFMGFDKNDRLVCSEDMTKAKADELGIRDAVCFQWNNVLIEQSGDEIKLHYSDNNTGTSQRTAIGQRADGTVILLVTDGRSAESIGATKNDLIDIMVEYGAVNAGMLDGGSSAMMYYRDYANIYNVDTSKFDGYQKMGLVSRYKAFVPPRDIPTFFVVAE